MPSSGTTPIRIPPNMMSVVTETNIFRSDDLAIDFFSWRDGHNQTVAITFTPFGIVGAVSLDGAGFGGELLLRNNFDIVAFKSTKNVWYQNITPEILSAVENFIATRAARYDKRVGYGSSMGGYAAIQFSRSLKLDTVFALSPQFEIDQPYDLRWHAAAQSIDFKYRIGADAIAANCKYFVAYDPGTEDLHHVEKLRELICPERLIEIATPFSGHPAGHYLAETGLIKDLALSVLKDGIVEHIAVGRHRKRSKTYFYEMSRRLVLRRKYRSAMIAIDKAIAIDDTSPLLHKQRSVVFDKLGQPEAALAAIDKAITIGGSAVDLLLQRSQVLEHMEDQAAALLTIDEAINIDGEAPELHVRRSIVLDRLGRRAEALDAIYKARRSMKNDAPLIGALSDRLAKHGDLAGALELVDKAIAIDANELQFHLHKCAVCKALGLIPDAISAGETALKLAPYNVSLLARLSGLHARQGGIDHWKRSFKLAGLALSRLVRSSRAHS